MEYGEIVLTILGVVLLLNACVWSENSGADTIKATVSTKNVTAEFCPHPCTVGNNTICTPVPCPPPPCFDPARYKPTDCCVYCPHGYNCRGPNDTIVSYKHWKIIDGQNCSCLYPGSAAKCI
ncbi:hypothetical protein ACF0H5_023300 [Mactra antiquata]